MFVYYMNYLIMEKSKEKYSDSKKEKEYKKKPKHKKMEPYKREKKWEK